MIINFQALRDTRASSNVARSAFALRVAVVQCVFSRSASRSKGRPRGRLDVSAET